MKLRVYQRTSTPKMRLDALYKDRFTLNNFCLQLPHAIVAYDCRKLLKHDFKRPQLFSRCIELS